jgi:hypothetical protein
MLADVASGSLGEPPSMALDRLLLRADRERRHPPALKGEDSPLGDHSASRIDGSLWPELARALLQRDRAQQATDPPAPTRPTPTSAR